MNSRIVGGWRQALCIRLQEQGVSDSEMTELSRNPEADPQGKPNPNRLTPAFTRTATFPRTPISSADDLRTLDSFHQVLLGHSSFANH